MNLSKQHLAILAVISTSLIWGAAPPIFKWSLGSIEPLTLGFLRFFFATIMVLPLAANSLHVEKKHIALLLVVGIISVPVHIGLFLIGLQFAPSINVPIIGAAGPIFIIVASGKLFHEKVSRKVTFGTLISLIGVLTIVVRPILETGWNGSILGNFFFLLSTVAAVIHLFLLKRLIPHYSAVTITFWTFFIGQLFFLPMMMWEMQQSDYTFILDMESMIGIAFGAFLSSGLAWLFHAFAVKQLPASEISIFAYMDPIVTALVALPLLNETITFSYLLGATLVFIGIFIAERRFLYHPVKKLKIQS